MAADNCAAGAQKNLAGTVVSAFLLFAAVSIMVSLWLGYFWRNTPVILALSIVIACLLLKRFGQPNIAITKIAFIIAAIAFVMSSYSFVFVTPFYSASADPAYLITIRAITDHIPETYAPYSDLKFIYQPGHALFAKLFVDLLAPAGIPDYAVQWILGSSLVALEILLVFLFASSLFGSSATGELAAALYLGSRPVFLDLYWGAHPMILGMLFVLAGIVFFHKRSKLAYVFAPAALITHPMAAASGILLLAAYIPFHRQRIRDALYFLPSAALALPTLCTTYLVLALSTLNPAASALGGAGPFEALSAALYYLPLWVGIVPSVAAVCAFAMVLNARKATAEQVFTLSALLLLLLIFVFGALALGASFTRLTDLISVLAVVFSASLFLPWVAKPQRRALFVSLVAVAAIALFLNSSLLNELRSGTQITNEEAGAAFALLSYDPALKQVLFLSPGRLKMAEYSNKIPFNPVGEMFLPASSYQVVHDAAWENLMEKNRRWKEVCGCDYFLAESITRTGRLCIECIPELGVEYAVVNRDYFPEEIPWQKVLSSGSIDVYSLP